ncbi:NIPSNAP family containing protein [Steroidobacter agaridevorans]|uniref:NIPSNAP family containing protein n=1 Tax=Steroidobacter agaridevorans TaxID=2695856 RepID=A0A829YGD3_9GAMM|nr:NIPSNAP family containing protein [Steroidobacter agaridevorans]
MNSRMVPSLVVLLIYGFGPPAAAQSSPEWPIIELRQYTLRPAARDVLIDLFEAKFVESQEDVGMKIAGTFRDLDRPDRFVWLRAFNDMPSRAEALNSFYSGPVWKAHGKAAAATMIDSSNVLLLRVTRPQSGLALTGTRPPQGATTEPRALIVVNIYSFERAVDSAFVELFERAAVPELNAAGIPVLATYATETAANNYPPLPIRTDCVFVWFTRFADRADYDSRMTALRSSARWNNVAARLRSTLKSAPDVLLLQPTPRSLLGG